MFSNIYVITNIINKKQYVGQTICPKKRWKEHKYEGTHYNYENIYLYNAMKKYGINNFIFKIIESNIDLNIIDEREKFWIKKLNTFRPNGYNLTLGGQGHLGYILSEETKNKLSMLAKERYNNLSDDEKKEMIDRLPKDKYDLDKLFKGYEKWKNNISKEDKDKLYKKIVKIKKDKNYDFYNFSFGKMTTEEKSKMYEKISKNNPRSQQILMLDENNKIIKEFHSIGSASRYLHEKFNYSLNSKNNIRQVLDKNKIAYGYKWKRK